MYITQQDDVTPNHFGFWILDFARIWILAHNQLIGSFNTCCVVALFDGKGMTKPRCGNDGNKVPTIVLGA